MSTPHPVPGLLVAKTLPLNQNEDIWTVPSGYVATVNINICNRHNDSEDGSYVSIALVNGGASVLSDSNWIMWKFPVGKTCEKTGVVLREGQSIVARTEQSDVNVQVWGFLEPTSSGLAC